jgi:O-antigen biosynthesis protein
MSEVQEQTPAFTGEFFVPGRSGGRIEADHLERYRFACGFAKCAAVLDIACGAGYSAHMLLQAGAVSYDGVDLNRELVAYDRQRYGGAGARFSVGDIRAFDEGRRYDLIACFETIEHVADYTSALENLFRLLKPGGRLLISSPNRPVTSPSAKGIGDPPANRFHAQEFTPDELKAALRAAGFTVTDGEVYGQRQRRLCRSWAVRKLNRLFFGNPDKTKPATVGPVTDLTPRYFVLVARNAGAAQ